MIYYAQHRHPPYTGPWWAIEWRVYLGPEYCDALPCWASLPEYL